MGERHRLLGDYRGGSDMRVGSLVKGRHSKCIGIVVDIHKRDLSCYRSHTYLVHFCTGNNNIPQWWQDYEMEVICE